MYTSVNPISHIHSQNPLLLDQLFGITYLLLVHAFEPIHWLKNTSNI